MSLNTAHCPQCEALQADRDMWHSAALSARADRAHVCSERDALAAQRDQLISRLNLEKGAATLLLAERDRLASQCASLRALLADTRPAIVARLATDPLGLDPSLLPRIDAELA